ncbi:MAG: sporulation protein YunB [Clostridia bacterium]|nr:sporulation protein YunB [Clostridia bacterium]
MKSRLAKSRFIRITVSLLILVILFILCSTYFHNNVVPVVMESSTNRVRAIGTNALNSAATSVLTDGVDYDDLFKVVTDSNGQVTMIQANSPSINKIAREVANLAQGYLDSLGIQEIGIAFGTFTGVALLTGFGPEITIKIVPIGSANCDFVSEFVSAGINQTVHKIYIDVYADIAIITPIDEPTVTVKVEILVCENLIVGKVPDTYLTLNGGSSIYDLVP